jgi:hypothetical protein
MENTSANAVFNALREFINRKPNLNRANYGCDPAQRPYTPTSVWWDAVRSYRQEENAIKRDGTRARKALKEAMSYPFNAAIMAESFGRAFSGRLSWNGHALEYVAGQYFPTEYRKAAAAVLETYNHAVKPKFVPPTGQIFYSAADIERAADRAGSHFFDRDAKRFFRSRILPDAWHGNGGCYFVTSEQYEDSRGYRAKRRYTVQKFDPATADISTFGPFNVLTKAQAIRAARVASEYPDAAQEYLSQFKEAWAR